LLVLGWYLTVAIYSFTFDQLFIVLVPALVVWFEGAVIFPSEPEFVQNFRSVKSKFLIGVAVSLCANPPPKRLVLLVTLWYHAIAILSFIFEQLFILLAPELLVWFEGGVGTVSFPSEPDFVQSSLSIQSNFVLSCPLVTDPNP
jgi:hypothetical protein